nr:unnamed protein product [Amyelois transitella]
MEETILFPSPNWYQASSLAVAQDGWLIYGGPSKSLCVLEPLPADRDGVLLGNHNFRAHVLNRAHNDKICCVDISPEWPEKRDFLAGSSDGLVKQWSLEQVDSKWKLKPTQSHDKHHHDKEEVAGVAYSHDSYAITVGSFGNLVKWDIKSNVVKTFKNLKGFKPTCLACSPHIALHAAVGTKQGVIFVVDLTGAGKTLYKVRGQDDEITHISWCPQFEVLVKKSLSESDKKEKISVATQRMMKIRHLTDEEKQQLSEGERNVETIENEVKDTNVESVNNEDVKRANGKTEDKAKLEESGIIKSLPEDSFDDSVVPEDDMFDIYKDHEADEFGHKKYQPEDIYVKVKEEKLPTDYLSECLKLKEEILMRKNQQEQTLESLVQALDDAHINNEKHEASTSDSQVSEDQAQSVEADKVEIDTQIVKDSEGRVDCSAHVHKHLLATVSKFGSVRIWSKSGKLVGSCAVQSSTYNRNARSKCPAWATVLWYKPDCLLIADGKSQLLECNPLQIDCRNKLAWHVVHTLHRRGLFCIATNAPRVQSADQSLDVSDDRSVVWTAAQDRNIVCYSLEKKQKLASIASCGGFVYSVEACPYDAGKIAVSVGDGAVRVWETETAEDECKLAPGKVTMYWQNVQGKVLCVAWHPRTENLLAFSTAESRVGLIDTNSKSDKSTRNLQSALNGGIYSLCWGNENDLYACGGGNLVVYNAKRVDEAPTPISVEWEGQKWELSAVVWRPGGVLCGSLSGAVALLSPEQPHTVLAATFVFGKMIHTIDWHPLQTSSSSDDSPLKNLIAVCSLDKQNTIVILEYVENEDGVKLLNNWKTLSGHKGVVYQVCWSPHIDELLLSTSQDTTVRVWDVVSGVNTHIFPGHGFCGSIGACWSPYPQLSHTVLSGGSDGCLRMWDARKYPAEAYVEASNETSKKKKRDKKTVTKTEETEQDESSVAATQDSKIKACKKFLLPVLTKQMSPCSIQGFKKMLKKYIEKNNGEIPSAVEEDMEQSYNVNYIKIFGSVKEVNELLDEELERHEDTGHTDSWIMLSIFRGHIDAMIQFASQRDILCPFLISMAACVSLKYWKDASQLYLAQIDRLVAKGEEHKLFENRSYGGATFRKAATLLAVHDVKAAVGALAGGGLYKEAYILCRTRYMDSIAQQVLRLWAEDCSRSGQFITAAVCHVALGNLSEAANILSKSKDENWLSLAAEMAKIVGQTTFADHISQKQEQIKNSVVESLEEEIEKLPSRVELLMKEIANKDEGQGDAQDLKDIIENSANVTEESERNIVMKESGQGDVKDIVSTVDSVVESGTKEGSVIHVKENCNEKVEVLNGNHEAVNGN